MKTIIVWYRNDLRIHDHPALSRAVADADIVVPVFIFDKNILRGKRSGSNRNRFLLECLEDLRESFTINLPPKLFMEMPTFPSSCSTCLSRFNA